MKISENVMRTVTYIIKAKNFLRARMIECLLLGEDEHADIYRNCIYLIDTINDLKLPSCGEWIPKTHGTHECSICHNDPIHYIGKTGYVEILSEYCPNCGAKMSKTNEYDS